MNRQFVLSDAALEAMLTRRAVRVSPFGLDASIAESIAVTPQHGPWSLRSLRRLLSPVSTRPQLVFAAGALVLALAGMAAFGAGLLPPPALPGPTATPTTSPRQAFVTPLGGPTGQVALHAMSTTEAWAANKEGVWHFVDGRWDGPTAPAGLASDSALGLAVEAGGARVAIATQDGIAVLEAGSWTWAWQVASDYVSAIAFGSDGSLWTHGEPGESSYRFVRLEENGGAWYPTVIDCSAWAGGVSIAVTSDGTVWSGGIWGSSDLARYDGATCTAVEGIVDSPHIQVLTLAADATGGLVAAIVDDDPDGPWRLWIVRFDGSAWHILKAKYPSDGFGSLAVTPSGVVYLLMDGDVLRHDPIRDTAGVWQTITPTGLTGLAADYRLSVANDGSIWYSSPLGIGQFVEAAQ